MPETSVFPLPDQADVQRDLALWRAADPVFDGLLKRSTDPAQALRLLGLRLSVSGQLETAISFFTKGLALAPGDAGLWSDLAIALNTNAQHADARRCVERSLALRSGQPQAWLLLANMCAQAGEFPAAADAYVEALTGDAHLAEASLGLGLIHFRSRRFEDAARHLQQAVRDGLSDVGILLCLGEARFFVGDFEGAATTLGSVAASDNEQVARKYALYCFIVRLMTESVDEALDVYHQLAGRHAEDRDTITRTAFEVLSNFGHLDAAERLGRARLAWTPDDIIQRHRIEVLSGASFDRAPRAYVVEYFDRFADTFDTKLVDVLGYRVPEELVQMVVQHTKVFAMTADLGCGTGLAGRLLRPLSGELVGIDLSSRMLVRAKERGTYDRLVEDDILLYLETTGDRLDLLFAADVLIYLGDIAPLMRHAAARLVPGGLFAFSIETSEEADYCMSVSGRFAHRRAYAEALASRDFAVASTSDTIIRLEANKPVHGALYVLRRVGNLH